MKPRIKLIVTHYYEVDMRTPYQKAVYERAMENHDQRIEDLWRERVRRNAKEVRRVG
jgi:hypothetical protein